VRERLNRLHCQRACASASHSYDNGTCYAIPKLSSWLRPPRRITGGWGRPVSGRAGKPVAVPLGDYAGCQAGGGRQIPTPLRRRFSYPVRPRRSTAPWIRCSTTVRPPSVHDHVHAATVLRRSTWLSRALTEEVNERVPRSWRNGSLRSWG